MLDHVEKKIPVVEVKNCFELGKLVALKFIRWTTKNPRGVISLPTGKTPEYFIKYLKHLKKIWSSPKTREILLENGVTSSEFPDTSNLKFVQMDEFFPVSTQHKNSFSNYIKTYYLPILDIKPENLLLMDFQVSVEVDSVFPGGIADISLLKREACSNQEIAQQKVLFKAEKFCNDYEDKISALGGVGFFLGGIGPDGHIAFNMDGSSHDSKTRLIKLNYESAAVAASDLGGIEFSRNKLAMTIGLKTITTNKDATIVIMAAGEAKAQVIHDSVTMENKPAGALYKHEGACFCVTDGAASKLNEIKKNIPKAEIIKKIEIGLKKREGLTILHTAPHHDDIMLSYYPLAISMLDNNENHFAYLTSGFTAVTNKYLQFLISQVTNELIETSISKDYEEILREFGDAFNKKEDGDQEVLLFLKKVALLFECEEVLQITDSLAWLSNYFENVYPGQKDDEKVQRIKGDIRESEVDKMWAIHGVNNKNVYHMRSKFYTGEFFTEQASSVDVSPMLKLINTVKPDIITVAFDPEGTGPGTHYKVLNLVAEAVGKSGRDDLMVWGYRNIWHRFSISEANLIVPVLEEELSLLDEVFLSCFGTQRTASFPSSQFDGPFSKLSCKIQREQLMELKGTLGEEFFASHADARIRNSAGMLFLRQMTVAEFFANVQTLQSFENSNQL